VIRARILAGMEWCGLKLDTAANQRSEMEGGGISPAGNRIEISVIRVNEALIMAKSAAGLLRGK